MTRVGYRETLRRALVERCQRNPLYSLRAFARDLDLDPARLSDVLNGKRGLSRASATPIARSLGLSPPETSIFLDQVEALHSRSATGRREAQKRLKARRPDAAGAQLTLDAFRTISDWYHFAILQLLKLPRSKDQPAWLASALGIKTIQAEEALERLERLELIEKKGGRYRCSKDSVFSPDGVPSEAIRKLHEQILQKALSALYTQPVQERDFLNTLLPIDTSDLKRLRDKARRFNQEVCDEFSSKGSVNRVYSLSVQLFNVTPNLKEMENEK